jgi:hypothetical protein
MVTAMSLSIPVTPRPPSFWLAFSPFVAHCMMLYDSFSISTFYLVYSSCLFYNLVLLPLAPLPLLSLSSLFIYHISPSVSSFSYWTRVSSYLLLWLPCLPTTLPLYNFTNKTNLISNQYRSQKVHSCKRAVFTHLLMHTLTVLILSNKPHNMTA